VQDEVGNEFAVAEHGEALGGTVVGSGVGRAVKEPEFVGGGAAEEDAGGRGSRAGLGVGREAEQGGGAGAINTLGEPGGTHHDRGYKGSAGGCGVRAGRGWRNRLDAAGWVGTIRP